MQGLRLELSDARVPTFLWSCKLTAASFAALQKAQQLRVQFEDFAPKVVELLAEAAAEASTSPEDQR